MSSRVETFATIVMAAVAIVVGIKVLSEPKSGVR